MQEQASPTPQKDGLDTLMKILTILKLLIQLAVWGIVLGVIIWFLRNNPIPEFIEGVQEQAFQRMTESEG